MLLASRAWGPPDADRTIALIHGATGSSGTWWRLGPALAEHGWRAVGIDLACHGDSPCRGAGTLEEAADHVATTLPVVLEGRHPDAVLGHSLGAAVTMSLLARRPDTAPRVVLEDPPGDRDPSLLPYIVGAWRADAALARTDPEALVRRELEANPSWLPRDSEANVESLLACDVDAVAATFERGDHYSSVELLRVLQVPVLLLLGREARGSVLVGETRRQVVAALPPGSTWEELDGGHVLHRDRFDDYLEALRRFLEPATAT